MSKSIVLLTLLAAVWIYPPTVSAAENYREVCVENQNNNMGPDLCECMERIARWKLNDREYSFFYATAAKDSEKINKLQGQLSAQEKMNVITLIMKGPSDCAAELSKQGKKPQDQGGSQSVSGSAVGLSEATE